MNKRMCFDFISLDDSELHVYVWVWRYRFLSVLLVYYSPSFSVLNVLLLNYSLLLVFNLIPIFFIHYLQTLLTPLLSLLLSRGVSYQLCQFYICLVCVIFFCFFFLGTNTNLFSSSVCVILQFFFLIFACLNALTLTIFVRFRSEMR